MEDAMCPLYTVLYITTLHVTHNAARRDTGQATEDVL